MIFFSLKKQGSLDLSHPSSWNVTDRNGALSRGTGVAIWRISTKRGSAVARINITGSTSDTDLADRAQKSNRNVSCVSQEQLLQMYSETSFKKLRRPNPVNIHYENERIRTNGITHYSTDSGPNWQVREFLCICHQHSNSRQRHWVFTFQVVRPSVRCLTVNTFRVAVWHDGIARWSRSTKLTYVGSG